MCGCFDKINDSLKKTGWALQHNMLDQNPRALIEIYKIDRPGQKKAKGNMHMFSEFCPFCGIRYSSDLEKSAQPVFGEAKP